LRLQASRGNGESHDGHDESNECVICADNLIRVSIRQFCLRFCSAAVYHVSFAALLSSAWDQTTLQVSALTSFFVLGLRDHAHC
jgi:hypothetical protein